jgi:hypothetical protein
VSKIKLAYFRGIYITSCASSLSDKLFKNDKIRLREFNKTANTKSRKNSSSRVRDGTFGTTTQLLHCELVLQAYAL